MGAGPAPSPVRRRPVRDRYATRHGNRGRNDGDADPPYNLPIRRVRAAAERSTETSRKPPAKCPQPSSPGSCALRSRGRDSIPSMGQSISCSSIGVTRASCLRRLCRVFKLETIIVWVKTNRGRAASIVRSTSSSSSSGRAMRPTSTTIELGRRGRNRSNVWNYAGANTFRAGRMDDLAMHPT